MYFNSGMPLFRDMLVRALRTVYRPISRGEMPTEGRCRLTRQDENSRYVLHAMYACPVRRGFVTMIEDIVPLYDVKVEIDIPEKVRSVMLQPQGEPIAFTQENGTLRFTIPCVRSYQAVEINYRSGT